MPQFEINNLTVLIAAAVSMVIGFVWYGPLFGKSWAKLMGFTEKKKKEMKREAPRMYAMTFVVSLITAYVLAYFVFFTQALSATDGMMTGFFVWLGFVATTLFTGVIFGNKPIALYLINAGFQLVSLLTMGAILAVWI
ncbi:MAG: DUF1761 domain-containing protein [Candidatus Levybacteria bacterium]|nr:DUF1761 domain-containing protein [Candidatus Levybacteria bacterium]